MTTQNELAGIEYHGIAGLSLDCQNAVMRLLQYGDHITRARIVSYGSTHCLLITTGFGGQIAIKSGFSSGYGGEGPCRLSYTLQLLYDHGIEIDECEVDQVVIERADMSALTVADLENIEAARAVRPARWQDYVMEAHSKSGRDKTLWREFRPVVPFGIIDSRILDLALSFWEDPDSNLLTGYRRLEDLVRKRAGIDQHGPRLFAKAFTGDTPRLYWKKIDDGERNGRAQLFTGAYMSHRNPRAHRELNADGGAHLAEFLLLNHLYRLEKDAIRSRKRAPAMSGK